MTDDPFVFDGPIAGSVAHRQELPPGRHPVDDTAMGAAAVDALTKAGMLAPLVLGGPCRTTMDATDGSGLITCGWPVQDGRCIKYGHPAEPDDAKI